MIVKHQNRFIMKSVKETHFWLSAAEDFRRFRKGEISMHELIQKYPEFDTQKGYSSYTESVRIIIPEDCPLSVIPQIVSAAREENGDVCCIDYDIRVAYQPAWEAFPQWGKIKEICDAKEPVVFRVSIYDKYWRSNIDPVVDIRHCVHEGSHGDSDGYGIEDDTWIVGLLNMDGTWFKEWYIED